MEFVCKIGTGTGKVLVQTEQAGSEAELRHRLRKEGFYVFSVRSKETLSARWAPGRGGRIKPDEFLVFNQQFLTLSKSGLPLQKSLELLAGQAQSEALRAALNKVQEKVRAGALLSEAFESVGRFPKCIARHSVPGSGAAAWTGFSLTTSRTRRLRAPSAKSSWAPSFILPS